MGGLLFKTERFPAEDYKKLEKEVCRKLKSKGIKYQIPRYFKSKEDFGDLDMLVPKGMTIDYIKEVLKPDLIEKWNHFWGKNTLSEVEDFFINGDVISIKYRNFQIDFIRISKENWDIAYHYFSWNDLGNLIGRLFHKFGMKYGHRGLSYVYREDERVVGEITISKDINKILEFVGLNPKWFHKGFESRKEIFDFVLDSKYFNPFIYDFENTNKINRDRDKKRTTYKMWLEYISFLKPKYESYKQWWVCDDKKVFIPEIEKFFPLSNLTAEIERYRKLEELRKIRSDKFNGKFVMEFTGLKDKALGNCLEKYKKEAPRLKENGDFNSFLDFRTKEEIQEDFKLWYNYQLKIEKNKL